MRSELRSEVDNLRSEFQQIKQNMKNQLEEDLSHAPEAPSNDKAE